MGQLPPLASWTALGGRVCLLGDACHATAPFLGQGGNMAIQDAVCLARCLSTSTSSLAEATDAFEARRRQSCERIVAFARAAQLAGHKVQVFEKQPELSARGGSVMLAQAGRCIEEHLGLGQELQAIG